MAEMKLEITNRELVVFFGSVFIALFIITGGAAGLFDPLTAGIAVLTIVAFFIMGQWLESKGIFGSGMSIIWIVFGLSIVMIIAGLISRGVIPLLFYSPSASLLAVEISNALLYALLILCVAAVIITVYVVYIKKVPITLPFGKKE